MRVSLYAYCVTRLDRDEPWQVIPGLEDRPVFPVRDHKVAILVSRVERLKLDDPRCVVQHGQVVHRVFENRTVLPFRYGTSFSGEEEVQAILRQNHDQFVEALRVLRGTAEMHLKLQFRVPLAAPPAKAMAATAGNGHTARLTATNKGYALARPAALQAERLAQQHADRLILHLKNQLHPRADQAAVRYAADGLVMMDLRFLMSDCDVAACQKFSLSKYGDVQDCHWQVTGPWPPYHFLPVTAKLPGRAERLAPPPGRLPLRHRVARA
jgi:hypothetical protein